MSHVDRLSTLISHLEITAERLETPETSNLALEGPVHAPVRLILWRGAGPFPGVKADALLNVRIDIGGNVNPLFQVLPDVLSIELREDPVLAGVARLIQTESDAPRCGGGFALDRMCELLVVALLRNQIEHAGAEAGVLAGLAHPKLSRVLVAMHDRPGDVWHVEDFAQIAGMSRSQFMADFQAIIGSTPMAYLKSWRMELARGALMKGDRVNRVAHRFGYRNSDAFSRAFVSTYGVAPTSLRSGVI